MFIWAVNYKKDELKHLVRSLSYVYELENIPCYQKYYDMSPHVKQAIKMLEKAKIKPSCIIDYMRTRDELGFVPAEILPDDDMALGLVICQTTKIWNIIHHVPTQDRSQKPLLMYDMRALAKCNDVLDIYARQGENIDEHGTGIAHAASWAYTQLGDKKAVKPGLFRRPAARLQGQVLAADEGASSFPRDREGASSQRE